MRKVLFLAVLFGAALITAFGGKESVTSENGSGPAPNASRSFFELQGRQAESRKSFYEEQARARREFRDKQKRERDELFAKHREKRSQFLSEKHTARERKEFFSAQRDEMGELKKRQKEDLKSFRRDLTRKVQDFGAGQKKERKEFKVPNS